MALLETLMVTLAVPIAKFLLKNYLGEPAAAVGGGLFDLAKGKIKSYEEQKEAQRQFERIGERIVSRLRPVFERAVQSDHINVEAVARELAATLEGRVSAAFFLNRDLDPAALTAAFRRARPLPEAMFSTAETALYDRALDEAVRYVVEMAARLPRFEQHYAAVSLKRLTLLADDLEQVLQTAQRIEVGVAMLARGVETRAAKQGGEDDKTQRYEADYRQAVLRNLDYVELFGADIQPESKRQALSVAYVSLNVKWEASGRHAESLPVASVLDRLKPGAGRLLIRGEAGSGKSTLFRWTAIEAAALRGPELFVSIGVDLMSTWYALVRKEEAAIRRFGAEAKESAYLPDEDLQEGARRAEGGSLQNWRQRVPFLLRLRDIDGGRLPNPDDFPLYVAKELGHPPAAWVRSVLVAGRGLVLFDGVDEVANLHRETLHREIEAIIGAYPDNYYLVSTRPAAVPEGWLGGLGFREGAVDPMSDTDKARFVRKWHEAVGRELERQGRADAALPEMAEDLIAQLPDNPPVSRLATNPLLCAMICALHRDRSQKLPESQSELTEAICHMLLHRRERESGLDVREFPASYRELTYAQKRAVVQDIAHYMVRNEESGIPRGQAVDIVAKALKHLPRRNASEADEVLGSLIERSGVLRESRPGTVEFIHNTLKEYLAAERFVDDGDLGQLSRNILEPAWQPVVLFAAGTRKRGFATRLIQQVLTPKQQDRDEQQRDRRLFALRCRAMVVHLDPELEAELSAIERAMFPPRSMADAEALAAGGDAVVTYLQYRKNRNERETAACIRTLRLIGTPKAHRCLRGYLKDPRKTVWSELAQAVHPLDIEAIQDILLRGDPLPDSIRAQVTDLSPLSGLSSLQRLNLSDTPVTDLSALSGLSNLQWLDLWGTPVTDLSALSGLSSLQWLDLSGTPVTDLSALSGLSSLQWLALSDTPVTDLSALSGLSSLQTLDLRGTPVTDLSALSGLSSLQWLFLLGTPVTDLSALSGLSNLQTLDLSGTQVERLTPASRQIFEAVLTRSS